MVCPDAAFLCWRAAVYARAVRPRRSSIALALVVAAIAAPRPAAAEFKKAGDKVGRFMLNLRAGPALSVYQAPDALAAQLDIGVAVTANGNGYLLASPGVEIGNYTYVPFRGSPAINDGLLLILAPLGFQYDIPLPLPGLYVYPRLMVGYAHARTLHDASTTAHLGLVEPAVGVKFVVRGRWNVAFEPLSLPVIFNGGGAGVNYRLMFLFGFNA